MCKQKLFRLLKYQEAGRFSDILNQIQDGGFRPKVVNVIESLIQQELEFFSRIYCPE